MYHSYSQAISWTYNLIIILLNNIVRKAQQKRKSVALHIV